MRALHTVFRVPARTSANKVYTRGASHAVPTATIDVKRTRTETRGCRDDQIFLNSAGSSLPPIPVLDAQVAYLRQEESYGGYTVAERSHADLESFYDNTANLLGCKADEVAFVESATRGWTLMFQSLAFHEGDHIITSASDYGSNFVSYLQARDRWGIHVKIVPDDPNGMIDLAALREAAAHSRSRLISINHVPTCGGLVQPASKVGEIAKQFKVPYLLDACQSVGQIHVNVDEIGCDMLSATGRKFLRGPRGTGFIYIKDSFLSALDPCVLDQEGAQLLSESDYRVRRDARCFEQYEYNFAGKVGLSAAVAYALGQGTHAIEARVKHLATRLRHALEKTGQVKVHDVGAELSGIVTFTIEGLDSAVAKDLLESKGVLVSVSAASGGALVYGSIAVAFTQ